MSSEATIGDPVPRLGAEAHGQGVPPGYKRTAVGVIPLEWQVRPVEQMGEVRTGKALAVKAQGEQRPYLRTKNVFDGRIEIDDVLTMPMTDAEFDHFRVLPNDVLLNEGQSLDLVGRCAIYRSEFPRPCAMQNQLLRFRAGTGVCPEFAAHLFRYSQQTGVFARIAMQTTSIAHLGASRFERLELPWPKLESEQRAIAEALSDVDSLLGALEALIAKKRAIKQAAMQQLLTGMTRLPGFRGEWEVKGLGEVAEIISGATPSTKHAANWNGDIPWCTPTDITRNSGKYLESTQRRITREGLVSCAASLLPPGAILLCSRATIGELKIARTHICTNQGFKSLVCKVGTSNEFLYYLLLTLNPQMIERASGSTFLEIGKRDVASLQALFPCEKEQVAIATVLSEMDAEVAALEARRDKTLAIKLGMMQQLLSGRVRLVVPETAQTDKRRTEAIGGHSWAFNEAVVISVLAKEFGKEDFPLGRKRYTKLSYLLHRHVERKTEGYLKKAAGPYNPKTKYGGPERIALQRGYIREQKAGSYLGFVAGEKIADAEGYFERWYGSGAIQWLDQFRFKKNDELELIATVDMAAEELRADGQKVEVSSIKAVIRDNPEWKAKLHRAVFSDEYLAKAIEISRSLFGERSS